MFKCICQLVQLIGASLHMSTNTVCDAMYEAVRARARVRCGGVVLVGFAETALNLYWLLFYRVDTLLFFF